MAASSIDQLEQDLNWREAELGSMKIAVLEAPAGSVRQRTLLRAAWALLYAHYEGFTKFAWDLYLEALERKGMTRRDVCEELASFSLSKQFQALKTSMPIHEIWHFCAHEFSNQMTQPLAFETRLETQSNLWPELFRKNNEKIGVLCSQISLEEMRIKSLVGRRNAIAHGEKLEIKDVREYQIYENSVILVLHDLALAIVENLSTGSFLAPT